MAFNLTRDSFSGIQVRQAITGNSEGLRTIQSTSIQTQTELGFLASIVRGVGSLLGFLTSGLKTALASIEFTATNILDWFKEGFDYIWEFNFQISDEQIDKQIEGLFNSIQTRVFGVLGKQIGSITAIGIGGALAFYINPVAAKLLLINTADDYFAEILSDTQQLLLLMAQSSVNAGFLAAFKNTRAFIRKAYKDPVLREISKNVGIDPKIIDQWGEKEASEWSFSEALNQKIEAIKDDQLQNNIEEFKEEFTDAFWDTAFNMTYLWDQLQLQSINQASPQTVIYEPNRNQSERVYLHGTPDELRNQVISINANQVLLDNRDIGNVSVTNDDQPVISSNGIEIELVFYSTLDTPWGKENRKTLARHCPKIPNVDRSKFTWELLETSFRPSAFTDGNVTVSRDLKNGRKIVCRGNSKKEAFRLSEVLLKITEVEAVGTPYYSELDGEITPRWKPRKHQPMYLSHFYVRNYERATKYQNQGLIAESKQNITRRFNFGEKSKPVNFDFLLNEAFKSSID
ncbi:hypothetical protein [Okeania sp. SIO2B3]|uniref:hypothetical protein n=1 Tax=Okeania sp. SIO2B3 TaxID=2607784 RepID=UPI0013C1F79D|nr:hypothetical protein [Okeania sp. SIO2B3]NET40617.1 hypothetical protein [Okeania sp. SIO2B3]